MTPEANLPESAAEVSRDLATGGSTPTPGPVIASGPRLYRISPEHSEARYIIDEILSGNEETVVGSTDQIAGDVIIDGRHPENSVLGEIVVNAKTFLTGVEARDRAVRVFVFRSFILEFEFIRFEPADLLEVPKSIRYGELVTFWVAGDLTIRGVTSGAIFAVELRVMAAGEIRVLARATISREDFDIGIPGNQNVAWVDENLILEAEIVAFSVDE